MADLLPLSHAVEGGVNAVAKTADGGIYNVSGVLTVSKSADLAVLKADVKPQKLLRFLDLNKTGELSTGAKVAVVGSSLAGNEGSARETTITAQSSDRLEIAGATAASSVGSPVVNENGDVVGIVTSAGEKTIARPVAALDSVLSRVTADTQARWPQIARNESDTARYAEAANALCACAVISARPSSAWPIGHRPFPIDVRFAGKRYGYSDCRIHGKPVLRPGRDKNASAMEVCSQPGMASDSPSDVSNKMIKVQTVGLGFRVKSGWAAVVLLTDAAHSLQLADVSRIELCDPRLPETRQPYHAAMGKLETDSTKVNQRERVVRNISQQSLTRLLKGYRRKGFRIRRAALVVGSQIDPANIANPHIRAHALEGRLFRSAVEETLQKHEIRTEVLLERDAYPSVAGRLNQSSDDVKWAIQDLGRSAPAKGRPWRAEQKLAALAALFAVR